MLFVIIFGFVVFLLWKFEFIQWSEKERSYNNHTSRGYTQTQQQRLEYTQIEDKIHFVFTESNCCNLNNQNAIRKCKKDYCAGRLRNKILYYINSAKESIYVAMFTFNDFQLANSIIDAYRRGVYVRLILDKSNSKEQHSQYKRLKEAGKLTFKSLLLLFIYAIAIVHCFS